MFNEATKVKVALHELYSAYEQVIYHKELHSKFLIDPVSAISNIRTGMGVTDEVLGYKTIFTDNDNVLAAKEDAAGAVVKGIILAVERLAVKENEVIDSINAVTTRVVTSINAAETTDDIRITEATIAKALTALPHLERYESRITRLTTGIMSVNGVSTESYLAWLYGIYSDIKQDNLEGLLNAFNGEMHEKYLNDDTPLLMVALTVPDVTPPEYAGGGKYKVIANYIETPKGMLSGVDVVVGISTLLRHGRVLLADYGYSYMFDYSNKAIGYKDGIVKELEDVLSIDTKSLDAVISEYPHFTHRLSSMASRVISTHATLYVELDKRKAASSLVTELMSTSS